MARENEKKVFFGGERRSSSIFKVSHGSDCAAWCVKSGYCVCLYSFILRILKKEVLRTPEKMPFWHRKKGRSAAAMCFAVDHARCFASTHFWLQSHASATRCTAAPSMRSPSSLHVSISSASSAFAAACCCCPDPADVPKSQSGAT